MEEMIMEDRPPIVKIICILLTAVIVVGLLYVYGLEKQERQAYMEKMEQIEEQVRPYRTQRNQLKQELSDMDQAVSYEPQQASFMVGFLVTDAADIPFIQQKAQTFEFSPLLILDCTQDLETIKQLVQAAEEGWELMLYVLEFSEESLPNVLAVRECLESIGRKDCGVFHVRSDYGTRENIQLLRENGFSGCTLYQQTPPAGQYADGTIYFDYGRIRSNTVNLISHLADAYARKAATLYIFDMAAVHDATMLEARVDAYLEQIQLYAGKENADYATVAEVVEELSAVNGILAEMQAAQDAKIAELQAQIQQLQDTIDKIYADAGLKTGATAQ